MSQNHITVRYKGEFETQKESDDRRKKHQKIAKRLKMSLAGVIRKWIDEYAL
jgi:hypothetical protein